MLSKIQLFEYFLKKLTQWHCDFHNITIEEFNDCSSNDYSKLKVIKLHFFACSTYNPALDIFDDFYAMPYGHVESGIYSNLNQLENYTIDNNRLSINDPNQAFPQDDSLEIIDSCIANLRHRNPNIITISPFGLVDLSHKWFSWQYTFSEARRENLFSKKISPELIKKEAKIYSL